MNLKQKRACQSWKVNVIHLIGPGSAAKTKRRAKNYRIASIGISLSLTKPLLLYGIKIVNGVLSADHIHIFVEIPPHVSVNEFVKVAKGRSSRKIQQEFPNIRKKYWGCHFWGRGFFSSTSGNITDEVINNYIDNHVDARKSDSINNISLD
jgi:REP element-mobilizing transposase RayT